MIEINKPNLDKFKLLKLEGHKVRFTEQTINETLLIIKEHTYSPGDIIFDSEQGE
jgi:hypothetical protein